MENSEGDMNKANSIYMKYRVQEIKDIFTTMKIVYDEMSKNEISNYLKNIDEVDKKINRDFINQENFFLNKHDCNLKSINLHIEENKIFIRKRKSYYIFDRNTSDEYTQVISD
jgi:hypothetical protein